MLQERILVAGWDNLAVKVVMRPVTLHFGLYWTKWAVGENQSYQLTGHVNPNHLYGCLNFILQIALVANKHPTFYLEGSGCRSIALRKTRLV